MKCKVLNIRLADEFVGDEEVLNKFLEGINAKRIFTSFTGIYWSALIFYEERPDKTPLKSAEDIILSPEEQEIYDRLRNWRNEQARANNLQPYIIANNLSLKHIAKRQVRTKEDLLQIKGFGAKRAEKYGDGIMKVMKLFMDEKEIAY